MLKRILFGGESGLSFAANAGLTVLRFFAGASLAAAHGLGKISAPDQIIAGAEKLGFPLPFVFGWAAALAEFFGGAFLALGLFTRLSSFFIAFTMLVAAFGQHFSDPYQKKELALVYFFIAGCFLIKGAGDWSVDAFFRRRGF